VNDTVRRTQAGSAQPFCAQSLHTLQATFQELIRRCFYPTCDALISRPAVWRVVFEAAVVPAWRPSLPEDLFSLRYFLGRIPHLLCYQVSAYFCDQL
jgi:hypothetical protein